MTDIDTEQLPLEVFTEKAYLDYAMSVVLDRALPHLRDGLKPVQRRIVYAMSELGLQSTAKFKKSARTVGDVLGKFHPHGDQACYEAMVLMGQPFSYRYPLIEGQGNWGSPDDPKSFAAMRYTECRLSAYARCLLEELKEDTVDWADNFDGTLQEPTFLPARLPNLLLNGTSGIAVGMSTDIPPHNLTEVVDAACALLDDPKATVATLCAILPGPDFPTYAEIVTPHTELLALYTQGQGSVRARAVYEKDKTDIIITALPYQVSGNKVIEQIASQMQKKLPMVVDLRDESDHENPTRLVISLRSNRVDTEGVMAHLFATTDLERSYRVQFNVIGENGRPQVKNLVTVLTEWLAFRKQTITRRLTHRLVHVQRRLHILEGFLIAYLNLDAIIHIIREADDPKKKLKKQFQLSDEQVQAILDIKLRQLGKLEEQKITHEQNELSAEEKKLLAILKSPTKLKTLLRSELMADKKTFGDERRSPIVERFKAQALSQEEVIPSEPLTVVLSTQGWIRAAKGHDIDGTTMNYRANDQCLMQAHTHSRESVVFFDTAGKSYSLAAHTLPHARGHGEPLTRYCQPDSGHHFVGTISGSPDQLLLIMQDAGYGFITTFKELITKQRAGKIILKCIPHAQALCPLPIDDLASQSIALITKEGRILIIAAHSLPQMNRGKGQKMINISKTDLENRSDFCQNVLLIKKNDILTIQSGKRKRSFKSKDWAAYCGERGRRGALLPRGYRHVVAVSTDEE